MSAYRKEPDTTLHPNTHERGETSMIPLFMCAMLVASYTHARGETWRRERQSQRLALHLIRTIQNMAKK